jgi:hypothetical protein
MALLNDFLSCPTDCSSGNLPAFQTSFCNAAPKSSEIYALIFEPTDAATLLTPASLVADMAVAADWTGKIDNSVTDGTKYKYLMGKGSQGDPTDTEIDGVKNAVVVTDRTRTVTFRILDITSDATYDALRRMQCGDILPRFFILTKGGYIFGDKNVAAPDRGIVPDSVKVTFPRAEGKDAIDTAVLTIVYSGLTDPDRALNPLSI